MKKFIVKTSLIIVAALLPNFLMGVARIYFGDKNIPYEANKLIADQPERWLHPFERYYINRLYALTRDTIRHVQVCKDQFGVSNIMPNKKPDIVFIGDSYFADLLVPADSGIQASCNRLLGYNAAYNLGYPTGSSFKRYNEMLKEGVFAAPKIIVCEISERTLSRWTRLKKDLLSAEGRQKYKNYFGMDLLLGNNFEDLGGSKVFGHKISYGSKRVIDGAAVYFIENNLSFLPTKMMSDIASNLKFIQQYMAQRHIKVCFTIIPDKESLNPSIFGKSQLPFIINSFKAQGINIVSMYPEFIQSPRYYYPDQDHHWNTNGVQKFMLKLKATGELDTAGH